MVKLCKSGKIRDKITKKCRTKKTPGRKRASKRSSRKRSSKRSSRKIVLKKNKIAEHPAMCEDMSHLAKYANRPGPPFAANDPYCHYKFMSGNDGLSYQSLPNKNGIFRWKHS